MVAQTITIGSQSNSQFTYNIESLEALHVRAKLSNPANFGPSGTYGPYTFAYTTIASPVTEASINAAGIDIWWSGYDDNSTYTATELTEIQNWVTNGGIVLASADDGSHNAIVASLGIGTIGNGGAGTTQVSNATCFPSVTGTINNGGGFVAAFSSSTGYNVMATIATTIINPGTNVIIGEPVALFGNGYLLMTDINMITRDTFNPNPNDDCCISTGSAVTNGNDQFLMDVMNFLAQESLGNVTCLTPCSAGTTAPPLSATTITNVCLSTSVDLDGLHTGTTPSGASLVWSTDNNSSNGLDMTGNSEDGNADGIVDDVTTVEIAGTYYAYYYHSGEDCYSPVSAGVVFTLTDCTDTDTDTVIDSVDIDDDNDGILDIDEGHFINCSNFENIPSATVVPQGESTSGSALDLAGVYGAYNSNAANLASNAGEIVTAVDPFGNSTLVFDANGGGIASPGIISSLEFSNGINLLNGTQLTLKGDFSITLPGSNSNEYGISLGAPHQDPLWQDDYAGAIDGVFLYGNVGNVLFRSPDSSGPTQNFAVTALGWFYMEATFYVADNGVGGFNLYFNSEGYRYDGTTGLPLTGTNYTNTAIDLGNVSLFPWLNNASIYATADQYITNVCVEASLDTDNDGIQNYLDLDSDGDDCPDTIEVATPSVLTAGNIVNGDGTTNTTTSAANAIVDTTFDPVGTNGFANGLETATDNGIIDNTYTNTNYTTYALDDTKNGCGIPIITQVYWNGSEKIIEITNNDPTKIVVPNAANVNLFNGGTTTSRTATAANGAEITGGNSILFSSGAVSAQHTGTPIIDSGITNFDATNDIVTISRSGKSGSTIAWDSRIDVVEQLIDNTSFIRIDEALQPNTTYTATEWVAFVDDNLDPYRVIGSGGPERHPHDPLLSEITSGVNTEANALLGLHRFGVTSRTGSAWSNGVPDRSRRVSIDENYNHTGSYFTARQLDVTGNSRLSIIDNALIVSESINLVATADEVRLIGISQLVLTHTNGTQILGNGKLYIDQNSDVPSTYRYNYFGSPVNSTGASTYTVADVFKDGATPLSSSSTAVDINFTGGYNGAATTPISIAEYWIYTHGAAANWTQVLSGGAIPQTDGVIFKGPGQAQNYTFVGTPKDGTMQTAVAADTDYLLGNPYASAISVQKFLEDN